MTPVDASSSAKRCEEDRRPASPDRSIAPAANLPFPAELLDPGSSAFPVQEKARGRFLKRAEDLIIGSVLLVVFAPVMAAIALAIRLDSAGPIIYRQRRHAQFGKPFWLYKFRSMYMDADDAKHRAAAQDWIKSDKPMAGSREMFLADDARVTRVGRFIRNSHLDELPQLWNVLCGHMSIVGPRPPVPYEYEEYAQSHHARLLGKPGITGLWQVTGHHRLSFEEMVLLDIQYITEWSIWMDIRIMAKTIPLLLFGRKSQPR
jgi:lipopolysaccharide/colanic/teichoic acid biosynthesis glycosyltransferase